MGEMKPNEGKSLKKALADHKVVTSLELKKAVGYHYKQFMFSAQEIQYVESRFGKTVQDVQSIQSNFQHLWDLKWSIFSDYPTASVPPAQTTTNRNAKADMKNIAQELDELNFSMDLRTTASKLIQL